MTGPPLIGKSKDIERIKSVIDHVVDTGLNVVITGESGVGKEVVAQNLYLRSRRKHKPFIKINCAALPDGLLESELFGFEKGAFTGAQRKKRGKFELAHGGVLFLDEIGDMSLHLQSKLLHVLQSGEFAPLGSEKEVKSDAWVITATNQELEQNVKKGLFREDLYYRLNIIRIYIPPLCERSEDIPLLIDYYLGKYSVQFGTKNLDKPDKTIKKRLLAYSWPGNVRELQNVIKRSMIAGNWTEVVDELSVTISGEDNGAVNKLAIERDLIFDDLLDSNGNISSGIESFPLKEIRKKVLERVEKEVIVHVLDRVSWNRTKAARILKISYKTLLNKINVIKIEPPDNMK